MLGFFPTPHPDELLYSICARFSDRVAYPNAKSILQELFGASTASAIIDLPNRLGHLAMVLPAGALTTVHLIGHHTLLSFFSAFLPPARVSLIRKDMQFSSGPAAHMRSGVMGSGIPGLAHLRFCPTCKQDDEKRLGEPYWHKLHQLHGVEVCPSHQVFLENSKVALRAGRNHLRFTSTEQATRNVQERGMDIADRDHLTLLKIAHDAAWLLEHPSSGSPLTSLYNRHLTLLIKRGLATYKGSVHVRKLLEEFSSYYSSDLLMLLHCKFSGSDIEKTNWLLRLVRPPKHAQHPLYHLLLIQFLGCTVEEFFQLSEELSPFGEGPWPCLNTAANHYRQSVIMECQIGDRLRYGKPTGRFRCECGFSYARTGPDSSPEDRFRVGRTIAFGQVWEAKLKQLWQDSTLSLSEMGRKLGVDSLTILRHAARLELSFSRSGKEFRLLDQSTQLKGKDVSAAEEDKRHTCRSKWLSAIKRGRENTLKTPRHNLPREYEWLLHNDPKWLERHKPRLQRRNLLTTSLDWKTRDAEFTVAVKAAASRLIEVPGRPVQVTKTAIGRAIGAITLLQQKLHKMPLTAQVLASAVETQEQYAVRRIWWATALYCQEDILPRHWQLIMRANVYSLRDNSAVKCVIDEAINRLESKLLRGHAGRAAS